MACTIDFRCLDEGFGGKTFKRKRESAAAASAASMEIDDEETLPPPAKWSAVPSSENADKPVFGKPTYDGVLAGRVYGRNWKQVRTKRASAKLVSRKGTPFEERERQKEIKKAYSERMKELKNEIKMNKEGKRKKREEREKKKKENILRTGTKLQKVTNPKTIAKNKKSNKLRKKLIPLKNLD